MFAEQFSGKMPLNCSATLFDSLLFSSAEYRQMRKVQGFFALQLKILASSQPENALMSLRDGIFRLFSRHYFNWYIGAMWLSYLFAPYFYGWIEHCANKKTIVLIPVMVILFTVPFWQSTRWIIAVSRMPIFILGMIAGRISQNKDRISVKLTVSAAAAMILGFVSRLVCTVKFGDYLWDYGLHWYPFILIVPGLCLVISLLFIWLERLSIGRILSAFLTWIGKYTWEIFLCQVVALKFYDRYADLWGLCRWQSALYLIAFAAIGSLISVLIHNFISKRFVFAHRYRIP